jgi:hypothetical protein
MSYEELRTPITSVSAQPLEEFGKIYVKNDFIFVNELYKGVHIIDNQDPSNPEIVAFIEIPGNVDIAIKDNILYADSWIDLVVVDISDPANISEINRIKAVFPNTGPTFLLMEDLEQDVVFEEIDDRKGIVVGWEPVRTQVYFEPSSSCFPAGTEVLTVNGLIAIESVEPGTEVYTCDLSSGDWILSPVRTKRADHYEGDTITIQMDSIKIQSTGNHPFYVLCGERLASRPLPEDIPEEDQGMVGSGRWVEARDLKEGDVLKSKNREGLIVTSLSNGNEKIEVYHLEVEGNHNFAVHDKGILVHNKGDRAAEYEKAEPSSTTGKGGSLARFTIVDDYLYVLSGSDLQLIKIKNPATPFKWDKVRIGWDIETIFPYQDKLFIGGQEGMYIYDNKDPSNPVKISRFAHVTSCDPVVVEGSYAYVTLRGGTRCGGWNNRLEVIDISDIRHPKLIADYPMHGPYGLGIERGVLFICDGDAGVKLYDTTDPYNLKPVHSFPDIKTHDVILHNEIAMLIGREGLYQYGYTYFPNVELLSIITTQKKEKLKDFWNALSGTWVTTERSGSYYLSGQKLIVHPDGELECYFLIRSKKPYRKGYDLTITETWTDSEGVIWYKGEHGTHYVLGFINNSEHAWGWCRDAHTYPREWAERLNYYIYHRQE